MHGTLDLLEREEELSALDAALARARSGEGQVLAVEGPGGIGKTRLLAAARSSAREAGMRTLHARASELERSFTFGVVRQLLEPALFAADDAERDRWMSGAAGLTRSMFEDAGAGHDESSYARLHGLYWLCANLAADAPLLVCVDDAQWSDEPSLSFLGFLARRLEDLPVALVLGTRSRPEQESEVLRGLVTDPGTRLLRPPALTGAAVGQWVRATVDPSAGAAFCAACHETTGARPRRTATAGRDGLTPSELRVTEMAAGGQTNREIAQALFVTEKTVETHLGRAFMKLGVRSRKQLAQALDRETAEVV